MVDLFRWRSFETRWFTSVLVLEKSFHGVDWRAPPYGLNNIDGIDMQ